MNSENLREAKKQVKNINIGSYIRLWAQNERLSLRKLSQKAGMNPLFFYSKIKKGDLTGAEMIVIGNCLQVNPMEIYMQKLDETCRPTRWEKALKTELDEVKKRLADVEKERDLFKEMLMKK